MRSTIVFLQNAWSPLYAGGSWPRESWLRALEKSRSGQRLIIMIDDLNLCENTTPEVSADSNGIEPPDFHHIREIVLARKPEQIVACGKQATVALAKYWPGPLLSVPHPAHRLLTNKLYREARQHIELGISGRRVLRQTIAGIEFGKLEA